MLSRRDFRCVYDNGIRYSGPYFTAFCLRGGDQKRARVGFTTPRALGKAVVRNRIRRRVREAVRVRLNKLAATWQIVLNPKKSVLAAPFEALGREVDRLFSRCGTS